MTWLILTSYITKIHIQLSTLVASQQNVYDYMQQMNKYTAVWTQRFKVTQQPERRHSHCQPVSDAI